MFEDDESVAQHETDAIDRGDELVLENGEAETLEYEQDEAEEGEGEDTEAGREDSEPDAIPRARFNEVNLKYKEEREARLKLEEDLARARGASHTAQKHNEPQTPDIDELEEQYGAALMEGDAAEAKALRAQIRKIERQQLEQQAIAAAEQRLQAAEQSREAQRLEQAAQGIAQKYPLLDSQSADVDEELLDMVIGLRDRYIQSGSKPADALVLAAEKIMQRFAPAGKGTGKVAALKPQANVERNLRREAQIPPRNGGKGVRGKEMDFSALSDAQYLKLSEEEKARARGDYL